MPIFAIGEENRSPDRDAFTARFCSRIDIHLRVGYVHPRIGKDEDNRVKSTRGPATQSTRHIICRVSITRREQPTTKESRKVAMQSRRRNWARSHTRARSHLAQSSSAIKMNYGRGAETV